MDKAQISAPSKPNRPSIVLTGWAERNLLLDEDQDDRNTLDGADAFTFGPVFFGGGGRFFFLGGET